MKKQGFSLVELLVSVMVISIIAVAFAPIITKRIHGSVMGFNKQDQQQEKVPPKGEILFTPTTSGCDIDSSYAKCKFIVPEGVTKISVVAAGAGTGGGGGVVGAEKTGAYVSNYISSPYTIDHSLSYEMHGDDRYYHQYQMMLSFSADSNGGGGGAVQYMDGDTLMCATGGGASNGAHFYLFFDYRGTRYYNEGGTLYTDLRTPCGTGLEDLDSISYSLGRSGMGGASRINASAGDGEDGEDSYLYLTYQCSNSYLYYLTDEEKRKMGVDANGKYTVVFQIFGSKGGKGATYNGTTATAGAGGTSKLFDYTSDPTYTTIYRQYDDDRRRYLKYTGRIYYLGSNEFIDFLPNSTIYLGTAGEVAPVNGTNPPKPGRSGDYVLLISNSNYDYPTVYNGTVNGSIIRQGYGGSCKRDDSIGMYDGIKGSNYNPYVKIEYKTSSSGNYNGAAGGGGYSGGMYHITGFPVTPGEECEIKVGIGGKGGTGGATSSAGIEGQGTIVKCGTNTISTGGMDYRGNKATAQTSSAEAVQGTVNIWNRDSGSVYIESLGSSVSDRFSPNFQKYLDAGVKIVNRFVINEGNNSCSTSGTVVADGALGGCGAKSLNDTYTSATVGQNGGTLTASYAPPTTVTQILSGDYGSAGAGGAGGSWNSSDNTATDGGDGQDGYVFVYWGYDEE